MKPLLLEETKHQKVRFKYSFYETSHNLSYISWYKYKACLVIVFIPTYVT